jgi:hypothetical protein
MDFKGETPPEAADNLISFLREFCAERGDWLEIRRVGLLHYGVRMHSPRFGLALGYDGATLARFGQSSGLWDTFGRGRMIAPHAAMVLKLIRDEEGFYRWHRIAGRRGILRRIVPARGAHWFPLISASLVEMLTAEAPKERKVLAMKPSS